MFVQGSTGTTTVVRVWGHEVAWGSGTGGEVRQELSEAEEREGPNTVGSPASRTRSFSSGADTAVSIEREVVSGHAYAILTPQTADGGRCGYEIPTNLSADGVLNR
jgi:hypothetical protein